MDHSELVAKNVIEKFRPGCVMSYRANQSNGECDFDLLCGDGAVAAVEVTMATNPSKRRTRARISDQRRGGPFIEAVSCRKGWSVHPTGSRHLENT